MDLREATPPKGTKQRQPITPKMEDTTHPVDNTPAPEVTEKQVEEDYDGNKELAANMEKLKAEGLTKEDVFIVLDTLITSGNVAWDTTIFNKINCRFQVKPTWVTNYIMDSVTKIANDNPAMQMAMYNNLLAEYNVAATLKKYNDTEYTYVDEESFNDVYNTILQMPYVILTELSKKVVIFDTIIQVATSEWAVKNFTKPQSGK